MFVGNLAPETEGRDLRNLFKDFGTINDAWVARKPPGFGFVWFEDERDAVLFNNPCTMHYADSALLSAKRRRNTAPFLIWLQIYRDIPSFLSASISASFSPFLVLLFVFSVSLKISSMRARTLTGASVLAAASG